MVIEFDEVLEVLKRYPDFEHLRQSNETKLLLLGLEIYPNRRKAYRNYREIELFHGVPGSGI